MLAMDKDDSIGFRVPAALKRALEARAEAEHRSLGQLCTLVLMDYLERHSEWPPRGSKGTAGPRGGGARTKRSRS